MIVDFHIHPQRRDMLSPESRAYQDKFYVGREDFYDRMLASPETFLEFLKGEGVDYAVLLADICPLIDSLTPNEYVAEFSRGRDNLIPFCNINPCITRDLAGELERLVVDMGFKGIKLYPSYQHFYPNQARLYPLYYKAQELKIPVMFHTGSSVFPGARIKYGDPIYLDDVAVDFPELVIIQSHGGRGFWYERASFLAQMHKNVYIDISGLPPRRLVDYFPNLESFKRRSSSAPTGPPSPTGLPPTSRR